MIDDSQLYVYWREREEKRNVFFSLAFHHWCHRFNVNVPFFISLKRKIGPSMHESQIKKRQQQKVTTMKLIKMKTHTKRENDWGERK